MTLIDLLAAAAAWVLLACIFAPLALALATRASSRSRAPWRGARRTPRVLRPVVTYDGRTPPGTRHDAPGRAIASPTAREGG